MANTAIQFDRIPKKIPRSYELRVLRRMLPSEAEIVQLDKAGLLKLARYKDELKYLISIDPARFFTPNPGGQSNFMTRWDETPVKKRVLLMIAGNKTGKTTGGALLMGERLLGKALWGGLARAHITYPTPARGAVFAEDFESHSETILPNLLSWLPKGSIKNIQRNTAGHINSVTFENGSVLHFKTFQQGSDAAEGKDWDIAWCDEPPPRTLYTAIFRGLVSTGGKFYITATLLKETWLFDENEHEFVEVFMSSIHDNPWISGQARDEFLATLPDEEREVRESGKPMNLTGLIYKSFTDRSPYVIPDAPIPYECPVIIGIDPHERRPVHALYGYVTPLDEVVWVDYVLVTGNLQHIFDTLRMKERTFSSMPVVCIMDPNRGKAIQMHGASWSEAFEEQGYDVVLGQDDVNIGHTTMYNWLMINPLTKRPRMMFMESCRGKNGPVWQMLRYSWAEWAKSGRAERTPKEAPKQVNKDFPDICRYVAMEDLKYHQLRTGLEVLSRIGADFKPYGQVRRVG